MGFLLLLLAVGIVVFVVWCQHTRHITQYLFFIRYPLLLGAGLILGPWIGPRVAPDSLTNLLVMQPFGVLVVAICAGVAGYTIVFTGRLVWVSVPARSELAFRRGEDWRTHLDAPPSILTARFHLLAIAIAAPVVATTVVRVDPPEERSSAIWMALLGLGVATGLQLLTMVRSTQRRTRYQDVRSPRQEPKPATDLSTWQWLRSSNPYAALPSSLRWLHRGALFLFLVTLVVHVVVCLLGRPDRTTGAAIPALAYVLLLATAAAWVLGGLSFVFDTARVPG